MNKNMTCSSVAYFISTLTGRNKNKQHDVLSCSQVSTPVIIRITHSARPPAGWAGIGEGYGPVRPTHWPSTDHLVVFW